MTVKYVICSLHLLKSNCCSGFRGELQEPEFELAGKRNLVRVIRVRVNRVKMTEKWGQIQGKWALVRVSGGVRVIRVRVTGVLLYKTMFCQN